MSVETPPETDLLPIVCPGCGGVLGLALAHRPLWCSDCRHWVLPKDSLIPAA